MGHTRKAKCLNCGKKFSIQHGGGFHFHRLRCDTCGESKSVGFDQIDELHSRYIKGLPGPYCIAGSEHDAEIQGCASIEPISEADYKTGVEALAGNCNCGGQFRFDAPLRCPECKSTNIKEGEITEMYD